MREYLKVVVTGDVDSGKSTLIGRFLYENHSLARGVIKEIENAFQGPRENFEFAYLLDSFEEEKIGNLTIDTTQVFCKTKKGEGIIFIDVPGHKELLKNMLCGSSYADTAILVVDVQKSTTEQTKRHVFILKFLGIEQIILVLNKMDLAGFKERTFQESKRDVIKLFKSLGLQPLYCIPASAKHGDNLLNRFKNMPWYKGLTLSQALGSDFHNIERGAGFRFPIQDIYNLQGGRVAVGEIISGKIKTGDTVNILPLNKECVVEEIKAFNEHRRMAGAPESIGLLLDDMAVLKRGQVVCRQKLPNATTQISAKIFCAHHLDTKEKFSFRCLTQETPCQISQIKGIWDTASLELKPVSETFERNDFAEVIISTENPVVTERTNKGNGLGRFVLQSNKGICAAGMIL